LIGQDLQVKAHEAVVGWVNAGALNVPQGPISDNLSRRYQTTTLPLKEVPGGVLPVAPVGEAVVAEAADAYSRDRSTGPTRPVDLQRRCFACQVLIEQARLDRAQ
jgi:hypothetical protein